MNYYPYYPMIPTRPSIFGMLRNFNFGSILSGTQKALNLANQAIPLIKQATPMFKNAKTMFKVMNEFRKTDSPSKSVVKNVQKEDVKEVKSNYVEDVKKNYDGPTFFI